MTAQEAIELVKHSGFQREVENQNSLEYGLNKIYELIKEAAAKGEYRLWYREPLIGYEYSKLKESGFKINTISVDGVSRGADIFWYEERGL